MEPPRIWLCKWDCIVNPLYSKSQNLRPRFADGSGGVYTFKIGISRLFTNLTNSLSCINHGIAVSWQDSDADCREPLIVNDDQLTPDLAGRRHTYPSGTDAPFCAMTIFYCQMNLSKILTHVIQIAFGLKRTNYSKILKLDEEVEAFRRNILPRVLVPDSPGFDPNLEPISMIMRCFYLKAILLLHRPFIGRSKENEQFKWSRERAVQAALLIVRNSIHLFTSANIMLENHFAAYPMLAHGLFPAPVALALDLYTYPDQPNPEPTRQALLEMRRVYLRLSAEFLPMKRLFKIVNVLMGKAWEKAGLTLPTEDLASRMGSFSSSQSTPSPILPNYDTNDQKWGPQGVVPTSMQQFLPTGVYGTGLDQWTGPRQNLAHRGTLANIPIGTADMSGTPVSWDAVNPSSFPLFSSGDSSSSGFTPTPQFTNEGFDMENNNIVWVCPISNYPFLTAEPNGMGFVCKFNGLGSCGKWAVVGLGSELFLAGNLLYSCLRGIWVRRGILYLFLGGAGVCVEYL